MGELICSVISIWFEMTPISIVEIQNNDISFFYPKNIIKIVTKVAKIGPIKDKM